MPKSMRSKRKSVPKKSMRRSMRKSNKKSQNKSKKNLKQRLMGLLKRSKKVKSKKNKSKKKKSSTKNKQTRLAVMFKVNKNKNNQKGGGDVTKVDDLNKIMNKDDKPYDFGKKNTKLAVIHSGNISNIPDSIVPEEVIFKDTLESKGEVYNMYFFTKEQANKLNHINFRNVLDSDFF